MLSQEIWCKCVVTRNMVQLCITRNTVQMCCHNKYGGNVLSQEIRCDSANVLSQEICGQVSLLQEIWYKCVASILDCILRHKICSL